MNDKLHPLLCLPHEVLGSGRLDLQSLESFGDSVVAVLDDSGMQHLQAPVRRRSTSGTS